MVNSYTSYYSNASTICSQFINNTTLPQFHEEDNSVEIFSIICLHMLKSLSGAISLLLHNQHFNESIALVRNVFEIFFSLHWVFTADNHENGKERTFQLEANPYFHFEKEVNMMESDLSNPSPVWSNKAVRDFRKILSDMKNHNPYLVKMDSQNIPKFKSVPDLASRMGSSLRLQYYHLYRFASLFTHPTPFLKELYFHRVSSNVSATDIIGEPLFQMLANGLLLIELGLGYIMEMLHDIDPSNHKKRKILYQEIVEIVNTANVGYFPKPNK